TPTGRSDQQQYATLGPMVDGSAADITARALALWGQPVPDGQGGIDAFRALYTDPVTVNGTDTDLGVLVDRARMLQGALSDLHHDVHEIVATPGRRAFAFTITGRHTGPLTTPLGEVPA